MRWAEGLATIGDNERGPPLAPEFPRVLRVMPGRSDFMIGSW